MATLAARNMCGLPLILSITEKNIQSTRHLFQAQQRSTYIYIYCLLTDQKAPNGGCPVNPMQDKTRGQTSSRSAPFLPSFEHTPLGLYGSVQSVTPGEKQVMEKKSNLHFSPSFPCFISSLTYKQLTS